MQRSRTMSAREGQITPLRQPERPRAELQFGGSYLWGVVPDALLLSAAILLFGLGVAPLGRHFARPAFAPATAVQRYFDAVARQDTGAALAQFSGGAVLREASGPCAASPCQGSRMHQELAALLGTATPRFSLEETTGSSINARIWLSDGSPHETRWQTSGNRITVIEIGPRLYDASSSMP